MKKEKKEIHMGEIVKARVLELKRTSASVASELNMVRQNMDYLYNQKSINVETLLKLSVILSCDFFGYYSSFLRSQLLSSSQAEEPLVAYKANPDKPLEQVVIELKNGQVHNVRHVKENNDNESKRILQLEGMLSNLVSTLKSSGLKFDYPA